MYYNGTEVFVTDSRNFEKLYTPKCHKTDKNTNSPGVVANSMDKISATQTKPHILTDTHNMQAHFFHYILSVPRGDGPLPEVGAIPGQPVKETKQASCILLSTKI